MGKSKGKGQLRTSKGGSSGGRFRERGYRPDSAIQNEVDAAALGDNFNQISFGDNDEEDESGEENTPDSSVIPAAQFPVRLFMWEFGQNDPKRDSGMKLCRFGYAKALRLGQSFAGIVLSSEAKSFVTPADRSIIAEHGIAGINCSWNRLDEIPFHAMGKGRYQRKLPLIVAANTVNYGKPYKMNTAEALAATLYIAGYKLEAQSIMYPFSYGMEFLRLNFDALEAYSLCTKESEILAIMDSYMKGHEERVLQKQMRLDSSRRDDNIGGYTRDIDLPSRSDDDEEVEEDEAGCNT